MKRDPHSAVRRTLGSRHACYILITCDKATDSGQMQVEMTYQGDSTLAAFLLEGAQFHLDQEELHEDCDAQLKVVE